MWIRPLGDADASCGGKALGLARLIAAGLRVPDGFVIEAGAFHEIAGLAEHTASPLGEPPPTAHELATDAIGHALAAAGERIASGALPAGLESEVRRRARALGRLAVRSSASLEDGARGAAAGVFASLTDVAADDVWDAIRAVWTSALTPLAVAYARRRAATIAIAVIVQRFVPGARVTVYTRPLGAPHGDELWLQRDPARDPILAPTRAPPFAPALERVPRTAASPLAIAARAAEAAITAPDGADVELVLDGTAPPFGGADDAPAAESDLPWIVQARPMVHPARAMRHPPPPILLAPLVRDGRRWTWDITHNPDPLSPAQAGLVAAVERAARTPSALQVCAGYLYTAERGAPPSVAAPADRAELAARIAAIEARFALDATSLAEAVERYVAFMAIWACELSPLISAARRVLLDRLAREGVPPAELAARAAALIGPRRMLRDRVMAPAWDVVAPTFAETADAAAPPSRDLAHAVSTQATLAAPDLAHDVALARAAADAGELDDLWFARAQWMVRRALLAQAETLGLRAREDIFWLPLDHVITATALDPDDVQRRASAARAAHARSAAWDMPRIVHGDAIDAPSAEDLRGVGFGARVVGRVVRIAALSEPPPIAPGDVVVTRAITPALAMIVEGCAALVSETGGLLDHGAALARELGVACVVGCAGAWTQLGDGMRVAVDGDAGRVSLIDDISST